MEAIALQQAQVDQLLGYEVAGRFIADALTRLGCVVETKACKGEWVLFRHHTALIWQSIKI